MLVPALMWAHRGMLEARLGTALRLYMAETRRGVVAAALWLLMSLWRRGRYVVLARVWVWCYVGIGVSRGRVGVV